MSLEVEGGLAELELEDLEAFLGCLELALTSLEAPTCGTLEAEVTVPRAATPEPYVAGTVFAVWLRLFNRDWVGLFSSEDLTAGGYPSLLFLVAAEIGPQTTRRADAWPIFNDRDQDVWTAVPRVGLPGTITVEVLESDRIAGTFEFEASEGGFVPPRTVGSIRSGRFDTAFVADLRPRNP